MTSKAPRAANDFDAIVIGSGMGGLTTAAVLARIHGMKVLVLERHYLAGGFTHTFSRPGGFTWDVGVHYVGQVDEPGITRDALTLVTGGKLAWSRMPDPYDRLWFPDFDFSIRASKERFEGDLIETFPAEAPAIRSYFADVERVTRWQLPVIRTLAPAPIGWAASVLAKRTTRLATTTVGDYLSSRFHDPRLRAVLGSRWGDWGLPPGQSAFHPHAVITSHYMDGAFYPSGSASRIAETIIPAIEAAGGKVRVRAEVERILVEDGRAVGVRLAGGEELRSPLVISDAGARNTYLRLLAPEAPIPFRDELARIPPSMAHACLYVGLSSSPADLGVQGENHWFYGGLDHDQLWARRGELLDGSPPSFSLFFPSMKDPEARHHTAEIIAPIDGALFARWAGSRWMKRGPEYQALKDRIADGLVAAVERRLPGFGARIAYRELSTPLSTSHFSGHPAGEIYGLPATPDRYHQRWANARTPVRGLFLTGADALMLGIFGAMMGGVVCAAAVAGLSTFRHVSAEARKLSAAQPPTASATSPSIA
jgi:phytoene dehydrogenase-like protein